MYRKLVPILQNPSLLESKAPPNAGTPRDFPRTMTQYISLLSSPFRSTSGLILLQVVQPGPAQCPQAGMLDLSLKMLLPWPEAQLVGVLSQTLKYCGFDPWSGRIPRLWVQSLIGVHVRGNRLMYLSLSKKKKKKTHMLSSLHPSVHPETLRSCSGGQIKSLLQIYPCGLSYGS